MEFGIFIQSYVPKFRREDDPDAEHHALMDDLELRAGRRQGRLQVRAGSPSTTSSTSTRTCRPTTSLLGYLAHATERIHLGSGIFNPLPQVNHPAKVAERVAMLDHLSDGRFEFGTGRGAGSHEILGFLPEHDATSRDTREIWEDVIGEFPKMWMQDEYEGYEGKYWSLPPRKILPKPYDEAASADVVRRRQHVAATRWPRRKGLGVLGFSVGDLDEMEPVVDAYKDDDRQRRADRRVRQRQRHGHHRRVRRRGRARPRSQSHGDADARRTCRATCSATTTRSRTPRGSRRGPSSSPTRRRRDRAHASATAGIIVGDPDDALAAVPAVGGGRRRPARVRHRARPRSEEHARDDPAHGRARHPQDRHRPRAPHQPVPRRGRRQAEEVARPSLRRRAPRAAPRRAAGSGSRAAASWT